MKAIKTIIMSMLLLAGWTTSCTNDIDETASHSEAYLKIDATVNSMTRGAIDATNFTKGDAIGVFVRDLEGKDYDATVKCSNIRARYDGSTWTLDSNVPLEIGKEAVVYAYYPYNADAVITGDSIDIDITKQDDVLYGNATGVTVDSPTAKINFKHALARLTLAITKGVDDVGEGHITNIKFSNYTLLIQRQVGKDLWKVDTIYKPFITSRSLMNYLNGNVRRVKQNSSMSFSFNKILTQKVTYIEFLLNPTDNIETNSNDGMGVYILFTIDGKNYHYKIPSTQCHWSAGKQYVYPITINRSTEFSEKLRDKVYMGINSDAGKPLYWSSSNLGATSIEDYGGLYGWGDATGKLTSTNLNQYPAGNPPLSICGTEYDTARYLWGDGWRMPSSNLNISYSV